MSAIKILTRPFAMPSTRLLKEALELRTQRRVIITSNPAKVFNPSFIRYGNADPVRINDSQLNSADFIRMVSNKYLFSKLMEQHSIYSPIYHTDTPQNSDFTVFIRKTLQSYGGRGIVVCQTREKFNANWQQGYYWTPYIENEFELRVHVLGGEIKKIFKKEIASEGEFPIRTSLQGYHFAYKELSKYPKVVEFVNTLTPVLSGKFYTLDVAWDAEKKKYFAFEANSASGLNAQTAAVYAEYLADKV